MKKECLEVDLLSGKNRITIDLKCALTIYKQTILPLLDNAGFMLLSVNSYDKHDWQVLQNNALRICFNVGLRDIISIKRMHDRANLLSLDQRRQKQVLFLLFIYNDRCTGIRRIHAINT